MTQSAFSVYDSKSEKYLPPFIASTPGVAERIFGDMVASEGHPFNKHPEDYTLYKLGTWEETTAEFRSSDHSVIATGLQVAER